MKNKRPGQQFFDAVEAGIENSSNRPIGMPPFDAIQTELKRLGFGNVDAQDVYDRWLVNGFRTKTGKIRDWKAAIRIMIRNRWLLSQRTDPPGLVEHRQQKPAQLREAERDRREGRQMTDEERRNIGHALRKWTLDNR
jgi:hypothetical protein